MHTRHIAGVLLLSLTSVAAQAEWKGKAEAGVVVARGNTSSDTVNMKFDATDEVGPWKHALSLAALRATSDNDAGENEATAERYLAGWQTDYKFSEKTFSFGALRYERDLFSGFRYQASATTGLGYQFISTDKVKFSSQVGVGYRRAQAVDTTDALGVTVVGKVSNNAIATAGLNFEDQLTPNTKLTNKLGIEWGSDDTLFGNVIALEVKMSTKLALAVSLDARYHTSPPDTSNGVEAKKLDTLTAVNLVYAF